MELANPVFLYKGIEWNQKNGIQDDPVFYMIFTLDDLCLSYLDNFKYFDYIKNCFPAFKLIAFTIANFKNNELLLESNIFKKWFQKHQNWVEIAVHSYDHTYPPDGDRNNEEYWIKKALNNLKPFLPKQYGYRSPGWQTTNQTIPILKKLRFSYIAFEDKINYLKEKRIEIKIINSHLYDQNSIQKMYEVLKNHYSGTRRRTNDLPRPLSARNW